VVVRQGDALWADFGVPFGSEPGGRRPVLVVQSDPFNRSRLATVVIVPLTTNPRLGNLPGNVPFKKGDANLPKRCAANVTQPTTLDRARLVEKIGQISTEKLAAVLAGLELVLRGVGER
jgi:mRNA interferase MazF